MMKLIPGTLLAAMLAGLCIAAPAQQAPASAADQPFTAGQPLKLPSNAKTYGGFRFTESVSYDADRDLYVAPSMGVAQNILANDGYVSLVNPDGSAHTLKWIGVNRNGLTLNDPRGSDIMNGKLYLADNDTVRWFDMKSGKPLGSKQVDGVSGFLNDLEVAQDGTIYATQTGNENPQSWRVYKITAQGESSVLIEGAPLNRPNGIAFDPKGNLVVVNIGSPDVITFSLDGKPLGTEQSTDAGNDGLAILPDGTKYVSSVRQGTVARIRPGQKAEQIASGIPTAASMMHDPKRNRLIIPQNDWNAITILDLNKK